MLLVPSRRLLFAVSSSTSHAATEMPVMRMGTREISE